MAVPAHADYLTAVRNIEELQQALSFSKSQNLPVLILGEGSNSLFKDDYHGLVILNRIRGVSLIQETDEYVELKVGAGENWHSLVDHTVHSGWFGLQNLALIPGLVGAAPMQNIGAYGAELADTLISVECLDIATATMKTYLKADCEFAYRESRFKRGLAGKIVITSICLRLSKSPVVDISYPVLQSRFDSTPSPLDVFIAICEIRQSKLPLPSVIPNTGSFFKNPVVDDLTHARLKKKFPALVSFEVANGFKLAAAWLIDFAGWKDKELDGVRVHQEQALVVVNPLCRPGKSVLDFAAAIQADIKQKFGVALEIEPRVHS